MKFSNISLFIEALLLSYRFEIQLWFISFKKLSEKHPTSGSAFKSDPQMAKAIRRAIYRAEKFTFWNNKCLVSTFCARKMLNKRGIASIAYLGMGKNEKGKLIAHAWINADDVEVVQNLDSCEMLYSF